MMDGSGAGSDASQAGAPAGRSLRSWSGGLDLLACGILVGLACLAAIALPEGAGLRFALAMGVLLFAPGYLLVEAAAGPAKAASSRVLRAVLAVGISPALVGLLALATAGLPGGFRAGPIVLLLAVACLGMAGAALWRRRAHVRQSLAQPTLA